MKKITLPKNYKETFTINDVEQMKKVIDHYNKDDPEAVKYAIESLESLFKGKAITNEAEAALNSRIYNAHETNSGNVDIWITATIYSDFESKFYIVGAYITDIWNITGDNNDEIKSYMYIREFKETHY